MAGKRNGDLGTPHTSAVDGARMDATELVSASGAHGWSWHVEVYDGFCPFDLLHHGERLQAVKCLDGRTTLDQESVDQECVGEL